jgi:hypothetical protein
VVSVGIGVCSAGYSSDDSIVMRETWQFQGCRVREVMDIRVESSNTATYDTGGCQIMREIILRNNLE